MCGIFGFINDKKNKLNFIDSLNVMNHRGPDNIGIKEFPEFDLILGHLRLSIIDLDNRASQPMTTQNEKYCIVFNGEIYNYKEIRRELIHLGYIFFTNSDTEVLLNSWQEWGSECLIKLTGMFAFAIYDREKHILIIARDRIGEKPLFFSNSEQGFIFTSELKAILNKSFEIPEVNMNALDHLLAYGFVANDDCIISGFNKLQPAHFLIYDLVSKKVHIRKYWHIPKFDTSINLSIEDLLHELNYLLSESVKSQLISDVPIGILLSGGLDSSIITGIAASIMTDLRTYTVAFPNNNNLNESIYASQIAQYFNTKHTVLEADDIDLNELNLLAWQFDEPMTDPSLVPTYLLCNLVRKHCKVALGGDGADELFGGYERYQQDLKLANISKFIPSYLRKYFAFLATKYLPMGYPGRYTLQALDTDFNYEVPWKATLFGPEIRKDLLNKSKLPLLAEELVKKTIFEGNDVVDRAMRNDINRYLPDDILVKSDRASMFASLELRAPFLDSKLVEFAMAKVPSNLKVTTNERKILLKLLAKKILPKDYNFDRKQGFVPPLENWFKKNEWKEFLLDHLLIGDGKWFNSLIVEKLWKGQEKGYFNKRRLFTLLMIELWRREYNIGSPL